jgi:hypothetical protein
MTVSLILADEISLPLKLTRRDTTSEDGAEVRIKGASRVSGFSDLAAQMSIICLFGAPLGSESLDS